MGDNGKTAFTAAGKVAECTYGGNESRRLAMGLAYSQGKVHGPFRRVHIDSQYTY